MDIRLLQTFHLVAKLGSFQKAAEILMYSQPTVTVHIQKLENLLGTKLIHRYKDIKLTETGRFLLKNTEALLQEFNDVNLVIQDFMLGEAGYIKLGVSEPTASKRLPSLLAPFSKMKPNIQFEIQSGTSTVLAKSLLDSNIDIALCYSPQNYQELEFSPLFEESMVALLYDAHPLAQKDVIDLEDLVNETLFFTLGECPFKHWIEHKIKLNNLKEIFKHRIGLGNLSAIKFYVQAEMGISILPKVDVTPHLQGTVVKSINNIRNGPVLGILMKKNDDTLTGITKQFKEYLSNELRSTNI